jgi:hypothetical protein
MRPADSGQSGATCVVHETRQQSPECKVLLSRGADRQPSWKDTSGSLGDGIRKPLPIVFGKVFPGCHRVADSV